MAALINRQQNKCLLGGKRLLLWNVIVLVAILIALYCADSVDGAKKGKIKAQELNKLEKLIKAAQVINSKKPDTSAAENEDADTEEHATAVDGDDDAEDDKHHGKSSSSHAATVSTHSAGKHNQHEKAAEQHDKEDDPESETTATDEAPVGSCGGRNRRHCVEEIFSLHDAAKNSEKRARKDTLADTALKRLNAIYSKQIQSTSQAYKYEEFIKQAFGEAEIFSSPMVFILEPWKKGRSSIVPVLLSTEDESPETDEEQHEFQIHAYGPKRRILDGLQLMRNQTYHDLQRFGKTALRHMRATEMPHPLLQRIRIIESPDLVADNAQLDRGYPMDDIHRWFAERADAVVLVLESDRLDIGSTIGSVLNEMDHQHNSFFVLINVHGDEPVESTLRAYRRAIWNVAPYINSPDPPKIYLTNFESANLPEECGEVYERQEARFLNDLTTVLDERFKNRLNMVLEHALEIRSHSLLVDRFVDTYMNRKSVFGNNKLLEKDMISYPDKYSIFESVIRRWNVSAEDLPEPSEYKSFFGVFPITQFNTLVGSCSFYGGCPHDRLNYAIEYDLPELLEKYERKLPICLSDPTECTTLEDKYEVRYKAPKKK